MIDCGEGTQLQCKKYNVKLSKIDHIFISHLHGDHYYGLIGLLSTMHLYGREKKITIAGPPGLRDILTLQLRYSETVLNYEIEFTEWLPNQVETVLDHARFTVTTIPLDHRVPCSGYLISQKPNKRRIIREMIPKQLPPAQINLLKNGEDVTDESGNIIYENSKVTRPPLPAYRYAYCSDTKYKPAIIDQIKGADMIYHEATFMDDMEDRAGKTFHSTAKQAASIAKSSEADILLIGHFSTRYKNLEDMGAEAQSIFPNTFLAKEGETFKAG
jgi:ribonuclease Z